MPPGDRCFFHEEFRYLVVRGCYCVPSADIAESKLSISDTVKATAMEIEEPDLDICTLDSSSLTSGSGSRVLAAIIPVDSNCWLVLVSFDQCSEVWDTLVNVSAIDCGLHPSHQLYC